MNYTKQVRDFCENNRNALIVISVVRDTVFAGIPYKTLFKIFNRLDDEGMITTVSKGIYSVGNKTIDEDGILSEYTDNGKGMIAGYTLFNKIGLTVYQDNKIEIYTNAIIAKQKNIGNFLLKKVDLEFTDEIIDLVALMEILNIGFGMHGGDYVTYKNTVELLAHSYNDDNFRKIIIVIRYKYSTIERLFELLFRLKIKNSCLDIYNE